MPAAAPLALAVLALSGQPAEIVDGGGGLCGALVMPESDYYGVTRP
ncbi:hypothetical protein [Streptomyces sp. NPDC005435]